MATHSSVLAWRIPGTGSLVGCSPWGRTESDTTERLTLSSYPPLSGHLSILHQTVCTNIYSIEKKKKKKNHATTADLRKIIWLIIFDFFCDLLVIQQRVVQPPYVGFFNSFSPG